MEDVFLTVDEVAELLRVNSETVRNWVWRGQLPAVRVGTRRVRIRRSDLDGFIGAGATTGESAQPKEAEDSAAQLRAGLADSLDAVQSSLEPGREKELAAALRSMARAASRLARALEATGSR